eukprot:snap_masked-scaffold_98-processed-gene-0.16-mRNA-1 protein AED:1.00 eAED:1.00 QI:0/0/0/0/1/1/4/0/146
MLETTEEDIQWITKTEEYRNKLKTKPVYSNLRVTATIVYRKKETKEKLFIHGTNNEPCWIAGSICAERCALVSLRAQNITELEYEVLSVYITSDIDDSYLTPGIMCREFMKSSGLFSESTPICMSAANIDLSSKEKVKKHIEKKMI